MKHPQKLLSEYGLAPQKGFGQNFLISIHWAEKMTGPILDSECDEIWEVGPGLGALTELLLQDKETKNKDRDVQVFEIDWGLIKYLKERFPKLSIIEGDFLEADIAEISKGKKIGFVSNLPYNISSAVFFKLLEQRHRFSKLVLTFQREFSERLAAAAGSKTYGATSVLAQYCFKIRSLGNLPQGAFYPAPDVVSQALELTPIVHEIDCYSKLSPLVKAAFQQRRKKLLNNLKVYKKNIEWVGILEKIGLRADVRAETLTLENFLSLLKMSSNEE